MVPDPDPSLIETEKDELRVLIQLAAERMKDELASFLKQFDLTPQQYDLLRIVEASEDQPLSTSEICDRMIHKRSDTSRIVDRLVAKDLLLKKPCTMDRRMVRVRLTGEGRYLLSTIRTKKNSLHAVLNAFSDDEIARLRDMLQRIHA